MSQWRVSNISCLFHFAHSALEFFKMPRRKVYPNLEILLKVQVNLNFPVWLTIILVYGIFSPTQIAGKVCFVVKFQYPFAVRFFIELFKKR